METQVPIYFRFEPTKKTNEDLTNEEFFHQVDTIITLEFLNFLAKCPSLQGISISTFAFEMLMRYSEKLDRLLDAISQNPNIKQLEVPRGIVSSGHGYTIPHKMLSKMMSTMQSLVSLRFEQFNNYNSHHHHEVDFICTIRTMMQYPLQTLSLQGNKFLKNYTLKTNALTLLKDTLPTTLRQISMDNIDVEDIKAFISFIEEINHKKIPLTVLELNDTKIDDTVIPALVTLIKNTPSLIFFSLKNSCSYDTSGFGSDAVLALVEAAQDRKSPLDICLKGTEINEYLREKITYCLESNENIIGFDTSDRKNRYIHGFAGANFLHHYQSTFNMSEQKKSETAMNTISSNPASLFQMPPPLISIIAEYAAEPRGYVIPVKAFKAALDYSEFLLYNFQDSLQENQIIGFPLINYISSEAIRLREQAYKAIEHTMNIFCRGCFTIDPQTIMSCLSEFSRLNEVRSESLKEFMQDNCRTLTTDQLEEFKNILSEIEAQFDFVIKNRPSFIEPRLKVEVAPESKHEINFKKNAS